MSCSRPQSHSVNVPSLSGTVTLEYSVDPEQLAVQLNQWRAENCGSLRTLSDYAQQIGRSEVIIFDTEQTSWPGAMARMWSGLGEYREIYQIGALRISPETDPADDIPLMRYIKPIINPILSSYSQELTHTSPEDLERFGISFSQAILDLYTFSDGGRIPLLSFGDDAEVIYHNAKLYGINLPPFPGKLLNIRPLFEALVPDLKKYSSGSLYSAFNLEVRDDHRVHNPVDDARSLAACLRHLRTGVSTKLAA